MKYTLENEYLRVTVTEWGAQVCSVVRKCDGVVHIWQADPAVWGYHAPILFPHTGKTVDNVIEAKGGVFPAKQHGFARELQHSLVRRTEDTLVLALTENETTLSRWPYRFCLLSTFRLEGDRLHHSLTVENRDAQIMHCGIGYHPAFAVPFDDRHSYADYQLRFSQPESPICLSCLPYGLVTNQSYRLGENITTIPIDDRLFANDSHCMVNVMSETLGIYENGSGRGVECTLTGFPYTLLWSKPGVPKFVCIEPWLSLPSPEGGSRVWQEKPAAWILAPGESKTVTLTTRYVR
jgi:aldose 1-epimerase